MRQGRVQSGLGAVSGRSRFWSACKGGCIGFVEILMSRCFRGKQLQIARRHTMVGSRWSWVANGGAALGLKGKCRLDVCSGSGRVRGGLGVGSGRSRFLSACNGEVLMSQCYWGKQLQMARRPCACYWERRLQFDGVSVVLTCRVSVRKRRESVACSGRSRGSPAAVSFLVCAQWCFSQCFWGKQLQIARRLIMVGSVGSRWG